MLFKNKTVVITGASRGIGKAIAIKLAGEGANIVIAAKSVEENPKLGGTIFSAAKEIEGAGGRALPIQCDIRSEDQIKNVIEKTIETFGVKTISQPAYSYFITAIKFRSKMVCPSCCLHTNQIQHEHDDHWLGCRI